MTELFADPSIWLPFVFAALMGLSILIYVVLDGYDLGVGVLLARGTAEEKDRMIASIGPFWDANETWLVMAVGLLLVAFPVAHGEILSTLYIPVVVMLIGLILRGVSFEFRAKAQPDHKAGWNAAFVAGSLMAALAQGYMLGLYVMGLEHTLWTVLFGLLTAACLTGGYAFIGACWLIYKTDGLLQRKAALWARWLLAPVALGFVAISLATPLVSQRIFHKWFDLPWLLYLAPLPAAAAATFVWLRRKLQHLPRHDDRGSFQPLLGAILLFVLSFAGLSYSFYPFVVPDKLTIYEAASAPESLLIILVGALVVMPVIGAYSALAYWIFRGKARELSYD
ncbi:cytochrome BD ubiquinol oxidase subunit II [Rhodovibrio sodomensis]|uniref:Cytochrome BD ubiquinol oxidase subunit II n=1 Tax=Rhodovibrio sodomensis TaxID=1088 RepID=A0ABS1DMX3_9PROT|nr:cytochrome d ubiquinol oxidase subunit II [Rhodovibrio sodomensis]MBK1671447.1 cytochrome BD ubiquinol oxidase subunit II [Rhodovibrio sodomensis]